MRCRQRGPRLSLRLQRQPETRRAAGAGQSGERGRGTSRHGKNADDSEHRRQSADAGKNRRCRVQQQCGGGQRARQTVEIRVRGVDGRTGKPDQTAGLFRGQTAGFHARPYVAVAGGGNAPMPNASTVICCGNNRWTKRGCGGSTAVSSVRSTAGVRCRSGISLPRGGRAEGRRSLCGPDCCSGAARGPGSGCSRMRSCCPPMPIASSTKPISPSSRPASPGSGHRPTSSVRRA